MTKGHDSPETIPVATVSIVPVEWLTLDRKNPRLITAFDGSTDIGIIAQLYRAEDLGELLQSIAVNGYLDIEPLVVLEDAGRLIVLEGNRRLAAIKLHREPDLASRVADAKQVQISVPKIAQQHRETLNQVSVYRVENRDDARSFIGFKHINGAARWDSYAKGKFAADWYRSGDHSISDIANRIGDRHDTVKRMVNAIYVLDQAREAEIFNLDDRMSARFNFSHLYTALSRSEYMQFLGLEGASWSRFDPQPNPVPESNLPKLEEVLRWLYGSRLDGVPAIVQSQNPDIKQLGQVLASTAGLTVLRNGNSLHEAHANTQPAEQKFSEALLKARHEIRNVSNNLRGFDGVDSALVDIAEDISETAQAIQSHMKRKLRMASISDAE